MQYKIVVLTSLKETADKVHKLSVKSKVYNSQEIMQVSSIKEVCEECARHEQRN